jgi:hypothetical protein
VLPYFEKITGLFSVNYFSRWERRLSQITGRKAGGYLQGWGGQALGYSMPDSLHFSIVPPLSPMACEHGTGGRWMRRSRSRCRSGRRLGGHSHTGSLSVFFYSKQNPLSSVGLGGNEAVGREGDYPRKYSSQSHSRPLGFRPWFLHQIRDWGIAIRKALLLSAR